MIELLNTLPPLIQFVVMLDIAMVIFIIILCLYIKFG